jgi:hypothetical protein
MSISLCLSAARLALHAATMLASLSEPGENPGALVLTAKPPAAALQAPSSSSDLPAVVDARRVELADPVPLQDGEDVRDGGRRRHFGGAFGHRAAHHAEDSFDHLWAVF